MPLNNLPDSRSPLGVELAFKIGTRIIRLVASDFLQSFTVELASDKDWTGSIILFDPTGVELEGMLVGAGMSNFFVQINFGWDHSPGWRTELPYIGRVTKYAPTFSASGVEMKLDLVGVPSLTAMLDLKDRSFPAGKRMSEIVREIAIERKWRTVDKYNRDTIETSKNSLDKPLQVHGISDVKFIREQLVKFAESNSTGSKGYYFFFDDVGACHFHTRDFMEKRLAAEYLAMRDSFGDVISFSPTDGSVFGAIGGAGNTVYEGFDSLKGARLEVKTSYLAGAPNQPNVTEGDASRKTAIDTGTHSVVHITARDEDEFKQRVAERYQKLAQLSYTAGLEVRGNRAVTVLDRISVRYVLPGGMDHYLSGIFQVHKVVHSISSSGWTTSMDLQREGISESAAQQFAAQFVGTSFVPPDTARDTQARYVVPADADTYTTARSGANASVSGQAATVTHTVRPGGDVSRRETPDI